MSDFLQLRKIALALAVACLLCGGVPTASLAQTDVAAEAAAWDLVRDTADTGILERFLQKYPSGPHAADARAKLDALNDSGDVVTPPATPAAAPAVTPESGNVVLQVQQELQRAGCSPGTPDGNWGGRSRAALGRFAAATGASLGGDPNTRMLTVLQAHPGRVCAQSTTTTTVSDPAPQPKRGKCVTLNVRATELDYNNDVWDWRINGNPEPDIIITEQKTGLSASCPDSFTCRLSIPDAPAELDLKIIDHDNVSRNQPIGSGLCSPTKGCQLANARVTVSAC